MLFHNYLEKLLGSKTKIKILRALFKFPRKDFTTREISKLIGVSHTGVLKALKELEEMNIIELGTHGRAFSLKLNEESILASKLLSIFEMERETINYLREELERSFDRANTISLAIYGSIAKKTEAPRSDIDLLIIASDKISAEEQVSELQEKFVKKFGNPISPKIMSPEEFKNSGDFTRDVLKHHTLIKGRKLEELSANKKR